CSKSSKQSFAGSRSQAELGNERDEDGRLDGLTRYAWTLRFFLHMPRKTRYAPSKPAAANQRMRCMSVLPWAGASPVCADDCLLLGPTLSFSAGASSASSAAADPSVDEPPADLAAAPVLAFTGAFAAALASPAASGAGTAAGFLGAPPGRPSGRMKFARRTDSGSIFSSSA